jgi:hypothetical protein
MRFEIDDEKKTITYYLALGHLDADGNFIRSHKRQDDRAAIIRNYAGGETSINESLTVQAGGIINLTFAPLDTVNVRKDNADIAHVAAGQIVTCEGVAEGDILEVQYYYNAPANMAFGDAAEYIVSAGDVGKDFRTLTGERSWIAVIKEGYSSGVPV